MVCGGGYGCGGTVIMGGSTGGTTGGTTGDTKGKGKDQEARAGAPATIVVSLPADAKLTVDGETTRSIGKFRVFTSPNLTPGKSYSYTLKAEVQRDGKPVSWEQTVSVQAGRQASVSMTEPRSSGVALR
jgi:uncharacterized protein (TIGR03000 family)